jgi:hypothetical protein
MSAIYDIAGTTSDSFMMNGKVTFLQGDADPQAYQGLNGDYYFQSNGSLWAKRNDIWLNLTGTALPDATTGHNKLLYSNGEIYTFANIEVTDEGTLITEDPVLIDPVIQKQDTNLDGGKLVFERADNDPSLSPQSEDYDPTIDFYNGSFRFTGKDSNGNINTPLTVDIENNKATTVKPSASNSTSDTTIPTIGWVNDPATATNVVHRSGDETIAGVKTFSEVIQGTAYRAYWGDLAEYYDADNDYPAGTLVCFGGDKEITLATEEVNAVVTSNPAVIMNGNQSFEHPCPIALVGRVPVRVIGTVNKFEYLQLSATPGVAEAVLDEDDFTFGNVIARALESKDTEEEGLVLCVVKFEL